MIADAINVDAGRTTALTLAVAAALLIVYPIGLGLFLWRRLDAKWRWFWLGVALQAVVALVAWYSLKFWPKEFPFGDHPAQMLAAWALAAVSVEGGRWLGYRYVLRQADGFWANGLMFGLGFAATVVVLTNVIFMQEMLAIGYCDPSKLTGQELQYFQIMIAAINSRPLWALLESQYIHLCYVLENMGLAVLVLAAWKRKQIVYLLLAVIVHTLFDFWQDWVRFREPGSPGSVLLLELLATVYGLLALALIFSLREKPADTLPLAKHQLP